MLEPSIVTVPLSGAMLGSSVAPSVGAAPVGSGLGEAPEPQAAKAKVAVSASAARRLGLVVVTRWFLHVSGVPPAQADAAMRAGC